MNDATPTLLFNLSLAFDIPNLTVQQSVTRGVLSNNYILTDGTKKYFLKQWRVDNQPRVEEILFIEQFFAQNDIPVILPLTTKSHELLVADENAFYSIYPYVEGDHIERANVHGSALDSMAILLGRIHLASNHDLPNVKRFKWWDKEKALGKMHEVRHAIAAVQEKSEFDVMAAELIERKVALIHKNTVTPENLGLVPDTLIHGDYHESNIFFKNDTVTHVFDFEKAEIAPRTNELIRCVKLTFLQDTYTQANFDRATRFIASYSNIFPISADEVRRGMHAWFISRFHTCWIEEEHYLKNNNRPDVFLKEALESLRYETDHLDELATYLTSSLT